MRGRRRRAGAGWGRDDRPKEACGVFGILAAAQGSLLPPVAQLVFDGLYALQHRGQESAGMAVSDGEAITVVKDMGLVTNVFEPRTLSGLPGHLAIGHTRYSTTGLSNWRNAQPVHRSVGSLDFALGHNGNLTNTEALAEEAGMLPGTVTSDSDLIAELVAAAFQADAKPDDGGIWVHREAGGEEAGGEEAGGEEAGENAGPLVAGPGAGGPATGQLEAALREILPSLAGAFSLVCMDTTHLIGVRDPNGFRPLCLGRLGAAWVLASESPALDVIGARFERELDPGEMVVIGEGGPRSVRPFAGERLDPRLCIFELVYFARPDTQLYGIEVHGARRRMGELLADIAPVEADLVMGVPESGVPAAEGYARRSGIPYGQGLVKNRYIGRTFISPDQESRASGVRRKLNPLRENIAGKRLVVVDDSVVRGTTQRATVRMLREVGAREIHLRVSSPPFTWPCHYGIDTPSKDELLAANKSLDEIREFLGVDSIAFLSPEDLEAAIGVPGAGFCNACLTGRYPIPVPVSLGAGARP